MAWVLAVAVVLGPGSAWADSQRRGSGVLREVDPVAKTLRVGRVELGVGPATKILDSEGVRLPPDQLWDRVGDPVRFVAGGGSPHPILVRIVLEDPDEDD